jgi:hypothetical protein
MRAARSDSPWMIARPRQPHHLRRRGVSRSDQLRMIASGLFSPWATSEIVWPTAAIFSACNSWWWDVAGVVVEPLPIGDVAQQRLKPGSGTVGGFGAAAHLNPHGRLIEPRQADREWLHRGFRSVDRVVEDRLQMDIGGNGGVGSRPSTPT